MRHINGLSPVPGAWVEHGGTRLKLLRGRVADELDEFDVEPGTLLDMPGLIVAAGQGAVELLQVQPAGRGPVSGTAFRNGARLKPGDTLMD